MEKKDNTRVLHEIKCARWLDNTEFRSHMCKSIDYLESADKIVSTIITPKIEFKDINLDSFLEVNLK